MADQPKEEAKAPQPEVAPKPRRRMGPLGWIILLVVLVGAGIGGSMLWGYLESYEDTDDAQIDGDIYAITSRIAGTVKAVYVENNQQVRRDSCSWNSIPGITMCPWNRLRLP